MANEIHAKKRKNGELCFRIYGTIHGQYLTKSMTEAELREWLLGEAIQEAIERHTREIDDRIKKVVECGTSYGKRNLNGPWDRQNLNNKKASQKTKTLRRKGHAATHNR